MISAHPPVNPPWTRAESSGFLCSLSPAPLSSYPANVITQSPSLRPLRRSDHASQHNRAYLTDSPAATRYDTLAVLTLQRLRTHTGIGKSRARVVTRSADMLAGWLGLDMIRLESTAYNIFGTQSHDQG